MITYVKICFAIPEMQNPRSEYPNLITKEFVVKDYQHLVTSDPSRIRPEIISCDSIGINHELAIDPTRMNIEIRTGKTVRHFHFNNVIWHEVDESD